MKETLTDIANDIIACENARKGTGIYPYWRVHCLRDGHDKVYWLTSGPVNLYNAPEWLFGILTSAMHMAWVRAIGGRLKTDYRYSAGLCYNPFPFPKLTEAKKAEIEDAAWEVLGAREAHHGKTLAELYDPEKMPEDLREAHHQLDLIVDSCYRERPFQDENERLELLLKLYEKITKK